MIIIIRLKFEVLYLMLLSETSLTIGKIVFCPKSQKAILKSQSETQRMFHE